MTIYDLGEGVMALTNEQVEHVALLARLGLSDEERERMPRLSVIGRMSEAASAAMARSMVSSVMATPDVS